MSHSELLPIPPIETACDPVNSIEDLRERWRALMGPLSFGTRLLWFGLIGPDRCFALKISRVPIRPRPRGPLVWNLMSSLRTLLDDLELARRGHDPSGGSLDRGRPEPGQ